MIQRWAGKIGRRLASLAEAQAGSARGPMMDPYLVAQAISVLGGGVRGYIDGLILSNSAGDVTNDLDIAAGFARDDSNAKNMTLAASLTKQLDAAWAVGTNAGGLDTGTIANTTYHIWLIMRSDTGVVDVLFSASATAPTMPASYDYKRLIGSVRRVGGAWQLFKQTGNYFRLSTPVLDINVTAPGASAVTRTLASLPTGVVLIADVVLEGSSTAAEYLSVTPLDSTDTTAAAFHQLGTNGANVSSVPVQVKTNTSGQVRSRSSIGGASDACNIFSVGWWHPRGTDQ